MVNRSRFLRFCIVGVIATAIDAALFYCFRLLQFPYQIALVLSYLISLSINYLLTVYWTFGAKPSVLNGIGIVACHLFNLFVVRLGLMWLFSEQMGLRANFAFIPTLIISVITNYLIIKTIVSLQNGKSSEKTRGGKIFILVPAYNEGKSLPYFYPEISKIMDENDQYEWEILFVDDGSTDNTLPLLQELRRADQRINYLSLSRNFGKENAMLAGFDYVIGDCMIVMDADLQDPPSLIPQMLHYWEEGYQDVYAKRRNRGKESWIRKQFSLLFYMILSSTTRFDVLQNVGDFRLLDRRCIDALRQMRESERYTKGMFCWIGFNKKEIVFDRDDRVAGKSNWNFFGLLNLAIEGITSFTTAPLRFASINGVLISFGAFIYGLYFVSKTLILGEPIRGFTTLIVVMLFLGGVQLPTIGILGEYIGRIFNETKHRPVYLVKEYNGEILE